MIKHFLNDPLFICIFILGIFITIPSHEIQAQGDHSNTKISELFKNPKKIQWVKHYSGRVDDINDVGLIMAYDGKNCKGFITYLRSKERFKLEGDIVGQQLLLRETDTEESVTGHFEGNIKKDFSEINAHWFNREKTRAGVLKLKLVDSEVVFPSYCGDNKWVRKYTGAIKGEKVAFILQRNSDFDLNGVFSYITGERSYDIKGVMTNEKRFKVAIIDDFKQVIGAIEGEINPQNHRITGYWVTDDESKQRIGFYKSDDVTVGCIEYQDYMTTYDVTYPKSKNAAFNSYIDMTVQSWKDSCQSKVKQLKIKNPYPGPDERSLASAAGWFRIEYLSDTLISGYITFNKSWEDEHKDIAFNYDLLKGQSFTLYELFKLGVDYPAILRDKALRKLQFTTLYGNKGFQKWLEETEFELFTIRENGIRFSTAFHPIYGRQSVTIPFEDLEEYLNPYSPVAYLYLENPIKGKRRKKINR